MSEESSEMKNSVKQEECTVAPSVVIPQDIQEVVAEIRERRTAKMCAEVVTKAIPGCICVRPEAHGFKEQGFDHSASGSSSDVWIDPDIDTLLQIIDSITQDTASASELATDSPDHGPASKPEFILPAEPRFALSGYCDNAAHSNCPYP